MDIRIDSSSSIPIRRQLTEQIIFLIVTEKIENGHAMPSVRELARRLKIHHNTVSQAYQDLVRRKWLDGRRGSRLMVTFPEEADGTFTIDDLINRTIATARENGYSLQQLRERVRQRLLIEPPDHVLVVEEDEGLRQLIAEELGSMLEWKVESCSQEQLASNAGLAIGALAVTPQHALKDVYRLFPKERPVVPVGYANADEHLKTVRSLRTPSLIAVVSTSTIFLEVARGILAPALGNRHELREILLQEEGTSAVRAADLVFCDSLAKKKVRSAKAIHYRLLRQKSVDSVDAVMKSYRE